jgi:hypothetical protein
VGLRWGPAVIAVEVLDGGLMILLPLVAFPVCPGPVDTDMCMSFLHPTTNLVDALMRLRLLLLPLVNNAVKPIPAFDAAFKPETVEDASARLFRIFDEATREKNGGKFLLVEGEFSPW